MILGRLGLQILPVPLLDCPLLDLLSRCDDLVLPTEVDIGRRHIAERLVIVLVVVVVDKAKVRRAIEEVAASIGERRE